MSLFKRKKVEEPEHGPNLCINCEHTMSIYCYHPDNLEEKWSHYNGYTDTPINFTISYQWNGDGWCKRFKKKERLI